MVDLLDRDNLHTLLEKQCNKNNSFIANINLLATKLDTITRLNGLFTEEEIEYLVKLAQINLDVISEDIAKGSVSGYRKLDINLLENFADYDVNLSEEEKVTLWNDPSKQVYYEGITVHFRDRTFLSKDFSQLGMLTPISNHHQLLAQLQDWPEFRAKFGYTLFDIVPDTPIPNHELLRIWDGEGDGSYIDRVILHVAPEGQNQNYDAVFAGAKEYSPVYTWANSTSVLLIIGQKINELLSLANSQQDLLVLKEYLFELTMIYANLEKLVSVEADKESVFSCLDELLVLYENLGSLVLLADNLELLKSLGSIINTENLVLKNSKELQVINSDIALGLNYNLQGTNGHNNFNLLQLLGNQTIVGSVNVPLILQSANSNDGDNHIEVITPKGAEKVAYLSDVVTSVVNDLFIGFCSPFAGDVIPEDCKIADGTIYNADDYPIACAVLGSKYGGDGINTFGVPNLVGESPTGLTWVILLGKDNGSSSRVYCGREGIYCGKEGLYAGCSI